MRGARGERLLHQRLGVVDAPDGGDGEVAQMGAHDQRLGLVVGDTADAQVALHVVDIPLKLGAEGRVFDVVDGPLEAALAVHHHAAAPGAEMGVVVRAEKQVKYAVVFQSNAEKSTHVPHSFCRQVPCVL